MTRKTTRSDDIIIPIMGPSGAGKSTFIKNALTYLNSDQTVASSDGFVSCTTKLTGYSVELPPSPNGGSSRRKLIFVDTPGFDNTTQSDTEILRKIANWLESAYSDNKEVAGVVYIYPVFPGRITRSEQANIKIFQKICGQGGLSKVVLATTMWNICPPDAGPAREAELWDNFWSNKLYVPADKSMSARLENSPRSAWAIVETILGKLKNDGMAVLAIQKQLVDKGKILQQTDAARELRVKILHMLDDRDLKSSTSESKGRMEALAKEAKELKIPLSKRIQSFFAIFINSLLPSSLASVSDGYASCTNNLTPYVAEIPHDLVKKHHLDSRRLVLVDTPGFNNTDLEDEEVLRRIGEWLAYSYGSGSQMKVGGVVYLFPYTARVTKNDRSKTEVFRKLCGENSFSRIVLATTQCNLFPAGAVDAKEKELRETLWSDFFESPNNEPGAFSTRFDGTRSSARAIIDHILGRLRKVEDAGEEVPKGEHEAVSAEQGTEAERDAGAGTVQLAEVNGSRNPKIGLLPLEAAQCIILKIQDEMVNERKKLLETEAAGVLRTGRVARPARYQALKRMYQPIQQLGVSYTKDFLSVLSAKALSLGKSSRPV